MWDPPHTPHPQLFLGLGRDSAAHGAHRSGGEQGLLAAQTV